MENINIKVVEDLTALADDAYRDFIAKLTPSVKKENILGVRSPKMKAYAKAFVKTPESLQYLAQLPHRYYEENTLHGFVLCNLKGDFEPILEKIEAFLPYIDNWAVCDGTSCGMKSFPKNLDRVHEKALEWMKSDKTYTIRFGLVTLLDYFLDDAFSPSDLELPLKIVSTEYYVNIAIAWYYSFALIKQYDATIGYFEKPVLSKWIHNKAIQKAIESYRVSAETKEYLRSLKIK